MNRKISTYYADPPGKGHCEVWMNFKDEIAYIDYFDDMGKKFYTEEFPNNSVHYVEDAAENWALGIKKLD